MYIQAIPIKRNEIYLLKLLVKRIFSITLSSIIFNTNYLVDRIPYILIDKVRPVLEKKINDLLSVTTDFMVKIEIENTN